MRRRTILAGYGILVAWAVLPFLASVLADKIAEMLGAGTTCSGNYSGLGPVISPLLNTMGAMVWLAMFTFPTGVFGIVVFTVVVVVRKHQERRGRAQECQPPAGGDGKPAPQP